MFRYYFYIDVNGKAVNLYLFSTDAEYVDLS